MAEPHPPQQPKTGTSSRLGRFLRRAVSEIVRRGYAVAFMVIILWVSWRAFRYLLVSLLFVQEPAAQVVDIPTLGPEAFERTTQEFAAARVTENPRLPPGHYHRFGAWFQPDRLNGCTLSGCHSPLPHNREKESRAFLNLHATSVHCGVCHMEVDHEPLDLVWYDLDSGGTTDPPAVLRAYAWVNEPRIVAGEELTQADQRSIVALLREAEKEAVGETALGGLAAHLDAVRVGSDDFQRLLDRAREILPDHFRGEYGAKLALRDGASGDPILAHPGSEAAVEEFQRKAGALGEAERTALLDHVHTSRRAQTRNCTDCHTSENSILALEAVGYPPARIESLVRPRVMQAVEHTMSGEPLYLPGFVEPEKSSRTSPDTSGDEDGR